MTAARNLLSVGLDPGGPYLPFVTTVLHCAVHIAYWQISIILLQAAIVRSVNHSLKWYERLG